MLMFYPFFLNITKTSIKHMTSYILDAILNFCFHVQFLHFILNTQLFSLLVPKNFTPINGNPVFTTPGSKRSDSHSFCGTF